MKFLSLKPSFLALINWIKRNKIEFFLLLLIISLSAFLRLWQMGDYLTFLGDEGRDMLVLKRMIIDHDFTLLGPTTSVGGFYLGPIYYYFALPFLWLWRLNPVGPAVMVSLFGIATVFLVYLFGKELNGPKAGLFASCLYAVSPLIVNYSRSSWNPNILPFFSLFLIFALYKSITEKSWLWTLVAGLSFGVSVQLHYLALILGPITVISFMVLTSPKLWIQSLIFFILGSLITFSPFLIFEIRHGFPNFQTIFEFVTRGDGDNVGLKTFNLWDLFANLGRRLYEEFLFYSQSLIIRTIFYFSLVLSGVAFFKIWDKKVKRIGFLMLLIWLLVGILGLKAYSGTIYDYYFAFLFPLPALLLGISFAFFWGKKLIINIIIISLFLLLVGFEISQTHLLKPPNRQLKQTEQISSLVLEKTEGKSYNFALISSGNSDHAYRYFFEVWNRKPLLLEEMVTDQLLIICESKECRVLGHSLWEIAGFGRAEIAGEWESIAGIKIFRLTHWGGVPSPAGRPVQKGV